MPLRAYIIMLQNARTVKVVHKPPCAIMLRDVPDLVGKGAGLLVCVSRRRKAVPQAHDDDLRRGVDGVDAVD